jgi:hypothetical protein
MGKLDELRARKAERVAKESERLEALELEALELEEKQIEQGLKEGVDFAVVTFAVGNFVVKKPDFIVAKQFVASADEVDVESAIKLVAPCVVFPEQMIARQVFEAHGGVALALANEVIRRLYGAEVIARSGKS